MKSLMPWFCLAAATSTQVAFADNEGLDAYRQGNYTQAAEQLIKASDKDPVVDYYLGRMRLYGYGQLKNNTQAIRYFKKAAEKGYLPAQQIMARYDLLKEKNPEQALRWFKMAADADDVQAQMYCAAAYLYGVGVKKNPMVARRYYIAAAKNGNSIAQYTLAEYFIDSRHAGNKKLGLIWLNKSVEQNNPRAQLRLGELYATGTLVSRDLDKAKELITLAASQDYVPAMYQLGEMANKQNNLDLAKDWFQKAADKNYNPAKIALAKLYFQAKSPLYDTKKGFLWMLKAAQSGSHDAQLQLAAMYKEGDVLTADEHLAKEWKEKADATAKSSTVNAQTEAAKWLSNDKVSTFAAAGYRLGGILSAWKNPDALQENKYNQAPQMDVVTRAALYKPKFIMAEPNEIAISEYYDALANTLGSLKHTEIIFPRYAINKQFSSIKHTNALVPDSPFLDVEDTEILLPALDGYEAFDSLVFLTDEPAVQPRHQSRLEKLQGKAILGDHTAQFTLGQMYQEGVGVAQNIEEAINLYRLAAAQKDLRAQYTLGIMYLEGRDIEADPEVGLSWLNDAAFKGNEHAQYVLARLKEKGYRDAAGNEVMKADPEQAIALYYLAAGNDYGPAQYHLAELLVREKPADLSVAAKEKRNHLIKRLYQGAFVQGVEQAALPLAFFNAMDTDKTRQADAFEVAKNEADKGDGQAALLLGMMFDRGIAVDPNQAEALRWYQQASLNPISAFILGTYYSQGTNVSQDAEKGRALLQQSADAGFSYANLNLAVLKQQQGERFLPELDAAMTSGNSKAGLLLADYYLSLASDEQQMKQARDIYQHFAAKGDKAGQLKLAFMYEKGLGGPVDAVEAEKWYTLAAEQGQPQAQFLLGHLYQLGWQGMKPDYAQAKKWYSSAQAKYAPAAVALGFIHDTVDDNYQQAQAGYQLAASKQDAVGQFNLGLIYEKGKGQPVDFEKAKVLYTQAAEQGHAQAMVQLAGLYFNGMPSTRDEQQALHWYKKAAALGDSEALYQLGLLSETGVATKIDFSNALNYYQLAAEKDNAKAIIALARMYQYGLGVKQDDQEAARLYKTLAALNNAFAQYQLATFYYGGIGGERNPEEGKRLLQQAQENGNQQASKVLQWLDAHAQERLSFIEPAALVKALLPAVQAPELMYLDALNKWNHGDEVLSRLILNQIMTQYPSYIPAKRAHEQLDQQQSRQRIFG